MSEKEFLAWLRGYVEGRISNSENSAEVDEILDTLNEHLNTLEDTKYQLLFDSTNPSTTLA